MPSRVEDYALIGDCHTAALVGRDGSIDWLCLPRFDSGACFCALLGTEDNGRWQIRPSVDVRNISRRYRRDTLILETDFGTDHGLVGLLPEEYDPVNLCCREVAHSKIAKIAPRWARREFRMSR